MTLRQPTGVFDDLGLISSDIAPTSERQRTLTPERERVLWLMLALGAASAGSASYLGESIWMVATRSGLVTLLALGAGSLLVTAPARFGVGAGPLSRSAFGTRASIFLHVLRYVAGVVWTALHLQPSAEWLALLVQASGRWTTPQLGLEWTATDELTRLLTYSALALLLGWVARGRVRRSRLTARVAVVLGGLAFIALFGVVALSRGWGLAATQRFTLPTFVDQLGVALVDAAVLVWSVPEWVRYRERAAKGRLPWRWAAIAAVAYACLLVSLAAVSRAARGQADGSLIADAAGSFGLLFGWVGAAVALMLTFGVLPLFGLLTTSLALCTAIPRWRYPYVAYVTTLTVTAVAAFTTPPTWIPALCLPPLAAVMVDELLVRRRLLILDEVYTHGGTRLTALLATITGCALVVLDRDHPAAGAAAGALLAMVGTALPTVRRLGRLLPRRRRKPRGYGPSDWADRPPLDHDWRPDETTKADPTLKE